MLAFIGGKSSLSRCVSYMVYDMTTLLLTGLHHTLWMGTNGFDEYV